MNTVILCNGNYAKTPYYVEEEELNLYSVEELCYYLYKSAFLLREDFFDDTLLTWIREELGLAEWADALLQYRNGEDTLLNSIEFLFLSTGYYGKDACEKIRRLLRDGSRLSVPERKKMRADAYCKRQRYALALAEYEEVLSICDEQDVKLHAKLYHNMGVAHAGMFYYEQAAKCFKQAFHIYPNTESYVQLLTALKLCSSQEEYLSYLSQHPESYEDSLEVESRLKMAESEWERIAIRDVVERMMEESQSSYYAAVHQLLGQAKEEYTVMVNKG